jgi:predicted nucleic acid-binding Zn ribbon protein
MRKKPSKLCPICGKRELGRNKNACSRACYSIFRTHKKICAVCGKEFPDPVCNDTKTCSPECSRIYRSRMHAEGKYLASLERAHEAIKT